MFFCGARIPTNGIMEEKFYRSKRELLEEAAAEIQIASYENADTNKTA